MTNYLGMDVNRFQIDTSRLIIRPLRHSDCAQWLGCRKRNYQHLQIWEPVWDMDHLTYHAFERILKISIEGFEGNSYYSFGIFDKADNHTLVGHVEINNILGWPKQSATIGYWIDQDRCKKGLMTESLIAICDWAYDTLSLIKLEAGTISDNVASQRVLSKVGFVKEGFSKSYGEIDGIYTDHILWGRMG